MDKLNEMLTCPACGAKDFSDGYIQASGLSFHTGRNLFNLLGRAIVHAVAQQTRTIDAVACNKCGYLMLFTNPKNKG